MYTMLTCAGEIRQTAQQRDNEASLSTERRPTYHSGDGHKKFPRFRWVPHGDGDEANCRVRILKYPRDNTHKRTCGKKGQRLQGV